MVLISIANFGGIPICNYVDINIKHDPCGHLEKNIISYQIAYDLLVRSKNGCLSFLTNYFIFPACSLELHLEFQPQPLLQQYTY